MRLSPDVLAVLQRHRARFLAFLAPRVGGLEAAEEVLQAALARALETEAGVREEERAVAWFYRLLRNALVDRHRAAQRAGRALGQLAEEEALSSQEAHELERTVCACVADLSATLKPEYAEALRQVDMQEVALAQYAQAAGLTYTNAKVRLHRARQALAQRLEAACGRACCLQGCAECPCEAV